MTTADTDELVDSYLERLDVALAGVPRARRAEILEEIANHIADERAHLAGESEADVLNILERLGEPAEVAAAAGGEAALPDQPRRIGAVEILALVLTPIIWPIGVILLWLSPAWSVRDKLIGTLLPPGGFWPFLVLPGLSLAASTCTTMEVDGRVVSSTCPTGWEAVLLTVGGVGLLLLLAVLPILTGIYLGWRLRQWTQAA